MQELQKITHHWAWFHVAEDGIKHRGQMRWLRARLPKNLLAAALLTLGGALHDARGQGRPEVALNHIYVTLDSVTLAAAETSTFLVKEFSHHRKETNRTTDGRSWTGVNLFGERTYVELFPRGQRGGIGFSGLALSVEQSGAIDSVAAWLTAKFGLPLFRRLTEGVRDGRTFRWFHSVSVDHPRGDTLWQMTSWVMEVHPDFYSVLLRDTAGRADDISRKRYLQRRYQPERLVRDIVGLSFALLPTIGEQLKGELEAVGWRIESRGEPGSYRAIGPEADIVVAPVARGQPYGIREIRFALNNGRQGIRAHPIGNSRLEICGARARWRFGVRESFPSADASGFCQSGAASSQ